MSEARSSAAPGLRRLAIGAIATAVAVIALIAIGGLGRNLVYYWGPSELRAAGAQAVGATIRLGGQVVKGSIAKAPSGAELSFVVTDGRATVQVHARGAPPQMFREGIGVVIEGTMGKDGIFDGRRLLVSHGNEYRAPKPGETTTAKAMMRTLEEPSEKR